MRYNRLMLEIITLSQTLKFFIGCSIYVCSCSTPSFQVRHFPLLQIPVTHSRHWPNATNNLNAFAVSIQSSDVHCYSAEFCELYAEDTSRAGQLEHI